MSVFEKKFKNSISSNIPLLDKIMYYIIKRKGKQLRPIFVFLSAKLLGKINPSTYNAASMIELLHTATLVHDDVIDESNFRRGFFSINALWKNKVAVLVGDFLLSKGLLLAVKNKEFGLLEIMSETVEKMSKGELLQIEKIRKLNITEEVYFKIIEQKTATLFAACCASGATSVNAEKETVTKMQLFGEKAGIAFQLKDDLFDYEKTSLIGKPTSADIKDRKMTLPLIYTLNILNKKEKKNILNIIKNHNKDENKIQEIMAVVRENGGVKYAEKMMYQYYNEALKILYTFKDNEAKNALILLLDFIVTRKK